MRRVILGSLVSGFFFGSFEHWSGNRSWPTSIEAMLLWFVLFTVFGLLARLRFPSTTHK